MLGKRGWVTTRPSSSLPLTPLVPHRAKECAPESTPQGEGTHMR